MPHDTSRFNTGEPARQLYERWRATSLQIGWAFADDWWVPPVDEVIEALCAGRDPAGPCVELGRARAEAGVSLREALRDLNALYAAVTISGPSAGSAAGSAPRAAPDAGTGPADGSAGGSDGPVAATGGQADGSAGVELPQPPEPQPVSAPSHLIQALAEGWGDVLADPTAGTYCEDPLTGLTVPAYLRVRLGEVYRDAERSGLPVPGTHALVLGEVALGNGELTRLTRAVLLAECMRAAFVGGESLCSLTHARALALCRRDGGLSARAATVRRLLARKLDGVTPRPARVWIEGLPGTLPAAQRLVADLAR